jgi:hypothetical protein
LNSKGVTDSQSQSVPARHQRDQQATCVVYSVSGGCQCCTRTLLNLTHYFTPELYRRGRRAVGGAWLAGALRSWLAGLSLPAGPSRARYAQGHCGAGRDCRGARSAAELDLDSIELVPPPAVNTRSDPVTATEGQVTADRLRSRWTVIGMTEAHEWPWTGTTARPA